MFFLFSLCWCGVCVQKWHMSKYSCFTKCISCFFKQVEKIICNLRPALKLRLRFITHISKMEQAAVQQQPVNNGSPAQQPSQVPVNVALPVTQWSGGFCWPRCDSFFLVLIQVKHQLIWNLVCCIKGKRTTSRFLLRFLLHNEVM